MKQKKYIVEAGTDIPFKNHMDYCVGTGRMGLALQKEYQEQLKLVQRYIGFKHIRGHGLFSDDMAIYHEYLDENKKSCTEYNFTYLDMVMDAYQEQGIKPFLELGFMPEQMASGTQTVFYWKGNVTPPKDYRAWTELVKATLSHLMERYGSDEVVSWPVEVWNEPNLSGFWENSDRNEYFRLFRETFLAVKEVDRRFQIGGPAICGVDDETWLKDFLDFCEQEKLMPDFITRHHYMFEKPELHGHYSYGNLRVPEQAMEEIKTSRKIIDSFPMYQNLPMHITEFNTSYSPDSPIHDTVANAAYVAWLLSRMGDTSASYSYWTFGDIFEEKGVPFTPFHGGFGLAANGGIPKPTFWTFAFFKKLSGTCVFRSDELVVVRRENGIYCGVAWNLCLEQEEALQLTITLPADKGKEYCLVKKTVDENHGNPLKLWHDMGEPSSLSQEQKLLLREFANPFIQSSRLKADWDTVCMQLELEPMAVVFFELEEAPKASDRGYSYQRAVKMVTSGSASKE